MMRRMSPRRRRLRAAAGLAALLVVGVSDMTAPASVGRTGPSEPRQNPDPGRHHARAREIQQKAAALLTRATVVRRGTDEWKRLLTDAAACLESLAAESAVLPQALRDELRQAVKMLFEHTQHRPPGPPFSTDVFT